MSTEPERLKYFENKDADEFEDFRSTIKAKAAQKGPVVLMAFKGRPVAEYPGGDPGTQAAAKVTANRELYYIMLLNTKDRSLRRTWESNYDEQGYEAMQYTAGLWRSGGNENKQKQSAQTYDEEKAKIANVRDAPEFRNICNSMEACRTDLNGTTREITNNVFVNHLYDAVSAISRDHKSEVKDGRKELRDDWRQHGVRHPIGDPDARGRHGVGQDRSG